MSDIPADLRYTAEHEWIKLEADGTALVGITDHAQASLGDVTFVELPETGDMFGAGEAFGVVESVKAASDLYLPIAGEIVAMNEELEGAPETLNSDPYGAGWIIRVQPEDAATIDTLMTPEAYGEIAD